MIVLRKASFTSPVTSPLKCIPPGGLYQRPVSDHSSGSAKFPIRKECSWRFAASQPANQGFSLTRGQSISDGTWATYVEWDGDLDIPFIPAEQRAECAYMKEIHLGIEEEFTWLIQTGFESDLGHESGEFRLDNAQMEKQQLLSSLDI